MVICVAILRRSFLALAEKQGGIVALMIGHTVMGTTLVFTGDIAEGRSHLDQAIALYDPAEHRPLATWFGQDAGVAILAYRAMALWMLGYPEAALADTKGMLSDARMIGQAGTLMYALIHASRIYLFCGDYAAGNAIIDECITLADEKNAVFWKAGAITLKGRFWSRPGKPQTQSSNGVGEPWLAVEGIDSVRLVGLLSFVQRLCGPWSIRRGPALHCQSIHGRGDDEGNMVRGRRPSNRR